ncbi:MAG TPA: hypothetical protein PLY08_01330 [Bacillota bacterium]|nr:hypothetical protein [Bacillota bacterium]
MENKTIKVGIGFATGRKQFQRILRSYVYNWKESGLIDDKNISLDLFVAYDLKYKDTKRSDYTQMSADIARLIDDKFFIGIKDIEKVKADLTARGVASPEELSLVFGSGYAAQRNIILYYAIKNKVDYLLFLDDDEYPMAATKNRDTVIWSGQHVLKTHLDNISEADITHGYHCGYISPIPYLEFDERMGEEDFRSFIKAISNDIVNWETIKSVMKNGGVSYASTEILKELEVLDVPEIKKAKFISGSNLCLNLTKPERLYPFYNPPGARGEDTFLSTCLNDRIVRKVPCYAFHDGFAAYNQLLSGTLPTKLKPIHWNSDKVIRRFHAACVGWIRYKPLLLYITDREAYSKQIDDMKAQLEQTIPHICSYFGTRSFQSIMKELKKYDSQVEKHYQGFLDTQRIWADIIGSLQE